MIAIFPELTSCAVSGDIEKLSILTRVYFGGDQAKSHQIDIKKILENAGIKVVPHYQDHFAAIAAKDDKGIFEITTFYKSNLPANEVNFNLAHCLGHILIDIEPKVVASGNAKIGFREEQSPLLRYSGIGKELKMPPEYLKKEQMADQFAAAILIPKAMLHRAIEKIDKREKVAEFFGVTLACLEQRLYELGFISRSPENFLEAERNIKGYVEDLHPSIDQQNNHFELKKSLESTLLKNRKNVTAQSNQYNNPRNDVAVENKHANGIGFQSEKKPGISRLRELARQIDSSVPD